MKKIVNLSLLIISVYFFAGCNKPQKGESDSDVNSVKITESSSENTPSESRSESGFLICHSFKSLEEMKTKNCIQIDKNGSLNIAPDVLERMKPNDEGLIELHIPGRGCFWALKTGSLKKTHCYDNGSDYFSEGYARYIDEEQKFGFMDKSLQIKIEPQFDFAFPFKHGVTKVCNGCKIEKSSPQSENSRVVGGSWSIVDKAGKVVKKCPGAEKAHQCVR